MKITISNNVKALFSSLSPGEIFLINGSDVCVKIDYENNTYADKLLSLFSFDGDLS